MSDEERYQILFEKNRAKIAEQEAEKRFLAQRDPTRPALQPNQKFIDDCLGPQLSEKEAELKAHALTREALQREKNTRAEARPQVRTNDRERAERPRTMPSKGGEQKMSAWERCKAKLSARQEKGSPNRGRERSR